VVPIETVGFAGSGLHRPECVLVSADCRLHVADWRGGVTVIAPDGASRTVLARGDFSPRPNGVAIHPEGGWLLAHLGEADGGVYRLTEDGTLDPFLLEVDGVPLPPTNYVHIDAERRIWITVSTRIRPRIAACRPDCDDGFIVLVDGEGARIVADGLGYTNECLVHPRTGQLFVNETFGRRLSRFDVAEDGTLANKTTVARFGIGEFPDGLTFDEEDGIWVTSIVSNRVIRIAADGSRELVLDDGDANHVAWVEEAFSRGALERRHLDTATGRLKNISSLAFGGPDRKTAYLGCLQGDRIAHFRAGYAGFPPSHWAFGEGEAG